MSSTEITKPMAVDETPNRANRLADRLLGKPLSAILGVLCVVQIALWAPSYLTWPYWADLDVFSTAARAWDAGILPYRDFYGNNFPGTIYEFWILGKIFGWGKSWPFLALDVLYVISLGLLLGRWSRQAFGSRLPGLIGFATFLGYYLDLDYTQVAQRDWQGPFFAVASILILQIWKSRLSVVVSGLAMAAAVSIRPQVVLFAPGVVVALMERSRDDDDQGEVRLAPLCRYLLGWGLAVAIGIGLALLPLIRAGVLDDFLRMLRVVMPGGSYNKASRRQFQEEMIAQLVQFRFLAVPIAIYLLGRGSSLKLKRDPAVAWLIVLLSVSLYKPTSPLMHAYLGHPISLAWSVLVGVLAGRIFVSKDLSALAKLLPLVLLMGFGVATKPRFSNPGGSRLAIGQLWKGQVPTECPSGYQRNLKVPLSVYYDWSEYRGLLRYLQTLPPDLRVANVLKGVPAINGPTGRLPVFPAESLAWLYMVHDDDETVFAEALRKAVDSVVIWSPAERQTPRMPRFEILSPVIEELYEFDRRFGRIEVWRRRAARP